MEITIQPWTQWCYIGKGQEVFVMTYEGMDYYSFRQVSKNGTIDLSGLDQVEKELLWQILN